MPPRPRRRAGEPIKIGSPYNLTGGYASIDNPAANGSRLAVKEINEAGGVLGRPLEIIIEDGKSDVPTITSVAKKLVEEDGVHVMAGLTDTSYMLAAGPVAQEAGIPFLDVGGTAPLITTVGDFIFMLPFGDNVQAAVAAEYAHEQGWTTAALLLDEAMDYTKFLAKYFNDRFTMEDIGGQIVSELSYSMGDTDFSAQLTEFVNLDPQPDFLFISSNPGEIGTIVRQARDLGLTMPIVGGDGYDTPLLAELGGDAATNIFFTTHQGIYDQIADLGSLQRGLRSRVRQPAGSGLRGPWLRRHQADGRRHHPRRHDRRRGRARRPGGDAGLRRGHRHDLLRAGQPDPVEVSRPDRGRRRQEQSPRDRRARGRSGGVGNRSPRRLFTCRQTKSLSPSALGERLWHRSGAGVAGHYPRLW